MPRGHDHLVPYQWQPGHSGNPAGRPKRRTLEGLINQELDQKVRIQAEDGKEFDISQRHKLALVLVDEMINKRNLNALALIAKFCPHALDSIFDETEEGACNQCGALCGHCHPMTPEQKEERQQRKLQVAEALAEAGFGRELVVDAEIVEEKSNGKATNGHANGEDSS